MRLDHLLSKEHVQLSSVYSDNKAAKPFRRNPVLSEQHASGGAHGWNIDIVTRTNVVLSVRSLRGAGTGAGWKPGLCTLLGPEGPGRTEVWCETNLWTSLLTSSARHKGYRP